MPSAGARLGTILFGLGFPAETAKIILRHSAVAVTQKHNEANWPSPRPLPKPKPKACSRSKSSQCCSFFGLPRKGYCFPAILSVGSKTDLDYPPTESPFLPRLFRSRSRQTQAQPLTGGLAGSRITELWLITALRLRP
jgi:hypothetical protein